MDVQEQEADERDINDLFKAVPAEADTRAESATAAVVHDNALTTHPPVAQP